MNMTIDLSAFTPRYRKSVCRRLLADVNDNVESMEKSLVVLDEIFKGDKQKYQQYIDELENCKLISKQLTQIIAASNEK